jgi:cyclophilin family peptidyl-prolyl cis-trans isomerase
MDRHRMRFALMPVSNPILWSLLLVMTLGTASAQDYDPDNTLLMDLEAGRVAIELRPDLAPKHVARLKELTRAGFYDGIVFHRVIPGFMAQTGDPTGTGGGGSDKPNLPAEFSNEKFQRGTIGMARTSDPNSANSQFFINYVATPHLDGQYTIVGQVVDGMEHVDQIAKGEPPRNPDRIVRMQLATEADEAGAAPQ